jgi:ligand-binding sensor domain-containing protein
MSVALVALSACDDTATPPRPDPAPQIKTQAAYTTQNGLPSNDVFDILVTSTGELWIGTSLGIARYETINSRTRMGDVVNELNGLPNHIVRRMIEYNSRVYVATWGGGVGIYNLTTDNWSVRSTKQGLIDDQVTDITASPGEDRIYFTTTNGVSIYNPTSGQFTSFTNLLDPVVSAVEVRDNGGGIFERWYGPRFDAFIDAPNLSKHGITVSKGSTVYNYSLTTSGLPEARVNDIYYDDVRGVYWVTTASKGVAEVNVPAKTWTVYRTPDGLASSTVFRVVRADDRVWVGTQGGLGRLKGDGRWQSYDRSGGLQADRVRVVYSDDGQRLWLGFINGGAARVNPASAQ